MFPFIPFFGEFYQRNIRGIVRDLKDPQREINKRRSEATNVIIAASKRGIVVSEGVDAQKLKDDWMGDIMPFIVLPKGVSWEVINPGPYPQGLAMAEQFASADIKEVSGVSPDLMGLQSPGGGRASGRAVALRQQQGITILATLIDSWALFQEMQTRWTMNEIQHYWTLPRIMRLVLPTDDGTGFDVEEQQLNQRMIDQKGVEKIVNDLTVGKYDVVIGSQPQSMTTRMAEFMMLVDLISSGAPIPPEYLIEASDLSNKESILKDIKMRQQQILSAASGMQSQRAGGDGTPVARPLSTLAQQSKGE